jgi:pre-mRNA-splicing factor ISY1
MARNSEKALSTLSRWRQLEMGHVGKPKKRPYLAELCNDLDEAEKWRREIISEISKQVELIQNAGLGEHKIRDMNDHINKLLREKRHWERRIVELGGLNHQAIPNNEFDDGNALGGRNYKYFGAAKDLPGVKELFAKPAKEPPRRTKAELLRLIDCDYFGYRDEDDGIILPLEAAAEAKARSSTVI